MTKGETAMSSKLRSQKRHEKTNRRGLIRFLAFAAVIVSAVFVGYKIINANIEIREYNELLKELTEKTEAMKAKNEQIEGYLSNEKNLENYIENMARDKLDFAAADERIYYVIPAGQ